MHHWVSAQSQQRNTCHLLSRGAVIGIIDGPLTVVRTLRPSLEACGISSYHRDPRFGLGVWHSASASWRLHLRPHNCSDIATVEQQGPRLDATQPGLDPSPSIDC